MDFGQAIRMLRTEHNMTQTQLAERCFVSDSTVSAWETGGTYPPKAALERLSNAFGVPMAYLMMACIEEDDFPEGKRILYRTSLDPLRRELIAEEP